MKFTVIKTRRQDGAFVEKFELEMLGDRETIKGAKEHVFMLNSCDNGFWYELVDSDIRIQRGFEFAPDYGGGLRKKRPILFFNDLSKWSNPF